MAPSSRIRVRPILAKLVALTVAALIWLPCMHLLFERNPAEYRSDRGVAPKARLLAARHLAIWTDPDLRQRELDKMQRLNPEWDFMSRTYFALALANMALRDPTLKTQACEIIDAILGNTLETERQKGCRHFLLGYAEYYIGLPKFGLPNLEKAADLAPEGSTIARFPAMLEASRPAPEPPADEAAPVAQGVGPDG